MKLIMFDYDGVLMDTFSLTKDIYLEISKEFNLNLPENPEYFRELFELDWRETLRKLKLTEKKQMERIEQIFVAGLRKYDLRVKPYKGIPELLEALSERYKLAVVTNNLKVELSYRLGKYRLEKYFSAIYTSEDGELKPHPDLINKCLKRFGVEPKEAAFIGDMDGDIKSAKAADIGKIVAVTYGYHLKHRLKDADIIVDSPQAILSLF
jgi:phosphoglycolate phosphatase